MTDRIAVYLEITPKRTFAGAVEWPGWCRAGKTPDEALEALLAYRDRYAHALARTRLGFTVPASLDEFEVVERLKGNATTGFGAPGIPPKADDRALDAKELKRQTAILAACWKAFEHAAERARGITLTKGPRGGGRDVPKMTEHVAGAEQAYLSGLGSRAPAKATALHQTVLDALAARAQSKPVADPNKVQKLWSPRFYLRRSAWHALDHAWEIDDRSEGA